MLQVNTAASPALLGECLATGHKAPACLHLNVAVLLRNISHREGTSRLDDSLMFSLNVLVEMLLLFELHWTLDTVVLGRLCTLAALF